jgi:hypothetical protein
VGSNADAWIKDVCGTEVQRFKIEDPIDGSFVSGARTVDLDVLKTTLGPTFSWTSSLGVSRVSVKGGPEANVYTYSTPRFADAGLHAPVNSNNGKYYGLSYVMFCYTQVAPTPKPIARTHGYSRTHVDARINRIAAAYHHTAPDPHEHT